MRVELYGYLSGIVGGNYFFYYFDDDNRMDCNIFIIV